MLTRLMVVIISQYIPILNYYAAYLKPMLYVIYISIKNYNNNKKELVKILMKFTQKSRFKYAVHIFISLSRSTPLGKQFQVSELQFPDQ